MTNAASSPGNLIESPGDRTALPPGSPRPACEPLRQRLAAHVVETDELHRDRRDVGAGRRLRLVDRRVDGRLLVAMELERQGRHGLGGLVVRARVFFEFLTVSIRVSAFCSFGDLDPIVDVLLRQDAGDDLHLGPAEADADLGPRDAAVRELVVNLDQSTSPCGTGSRTCPPASP